MNPSDSIYINPLTDFGFKYIFGREADKEFILSFLNSLNIGGDSPIETVEFIDKEKKGDGQDKRALIYDLHCKLKDGRKIIVEMQNRYQAHFADRALYYLAADLYGQGEKGDGWNYALTPVYGIFMMNFEWKGDKTQHLREDVCLYNTQTESVFSDKLRMTFLKIPMMVKNPDECKDTLERWLYLLKNMDKMEAMPQIFMKDPVFERLGRLARYGALNEKEKKAYRESLKIYRDNYAIAETERTEGRAEGIVEGKREERKESIRIMLSLGIRPEIIAEKYGMSLNDVEVLANEK